MAHTAKMTRKERDRQMREEDFLSAAEALFGERGYTRTTMEDIAHAAEYATGTIYRYFRSKEELYGELLSRRMARYFDYIRSEVERAGDPASRVRAFIRSKIEFFRRERAFLSIYAKEVIPPGGKLGSGLSEAGEAVRQQYYELLRSTFAEGIAAGAFWDADPDIYVMTFCSVTNDLLLHALRENEGADLEALEQFIERFFERGISRS